MTIKTKVRRLALLVLLRILGDKRLIKTVSNEAVENWMFNSSDDTGWRSYYQSRHTSLIHRMTRTLENRDDYLVDFGRLWELEVLRGAMEASIQKKAKIGVYKNKQVTRRQKKIKIR